MGGGSGASSFFDRSSNAEGIFGGGVPAAGGFGGFGGAGAGRRLEVQWSPCMRGLLSSVSLDRKVQVHNMNAVNKGPTPKWFRRPSGAALGFGGKLATFKPAATRRDKNNRLVRDTPTVEVGLVTRKGRETTASADLERLLTIYEMPPAELEGYCKGKVREGWRRLSL